MALGKLALCLLKAEKSRSSKGKSIGQCCSYLELYPHISLLTRSTHKQLILQLFSINTVHLFELSNEPNENTITV